MKIDVQMKSGAVKAIRKNLADALVKMGRAEYLTRDMRSVRTADRVLAPVVDEPEVVEVEAQTDEPESVEPRQKRKYTRKAKD